MFLAHVLGIDRLQLYLQHDRPLVPAEVDAYRDLVKQRMWCSSIPQQTIA